MDMPMANMKLDREDREENETNTLVSSQPEYPYGLRICLSPEVLKKLNLQNMPTVGQTMGLHAMVEVVAVRSEQMNTGKKEVSVDLQITNMVLQERSKDMPKDRVKAIYGDDDDEDEKETPLPNGGTLLGKG